MLQFLCWFQQFHCKDAMGESDKSTFQILRLSWLALWIPAQDPCHGTLNMIVLHSNVRLPGLFLSMAALWSCVLSHSICNPNSATVLRLLMPLALFHAEHIHAQAPETGPHVVLFMGKYENLLHFVAWWLKKKMENVKNKYSSLEGLTGDKTLGKVNKIVTFWIIEVKTICTAIKYSHSVQLWRVFIQNSYILPGLLDIKLSALVFSLCWTLKEEY